MTISNLVKPKKINTPKIIRLTKTIAICEDADGLAGYTSDAGVDIYLKQKIQMSTHRPELACRQDLREYCRILAQGRWFGWNRQKFLQCLNSYKQCQPEPATYQLKQLKIKASHHE